MGPNPTPEPTPEPTSSFFSILNPSTGKVLDVTGGKCHNGNNIHLWEYNGGRGQQFYLGPNNSIMSVLCNKAIDIAGSCADFTNIYIWDYDGNWNQQFNFEMVEFGISLVTNRSTMQEG